MRRREAKSDKEKKVTINKANDCCLLINKVMLIGRLPNDDDRKDDEIGSGGSDSVFLISGFILLN